MKKALIVFAIFSLIFCGLLQSEALAWSAQDVIRYIFDYNTHKLLTPDAIDSLDKAEYPDIEVFRDQIIKGSSDSFRTEGFAHDNLTEKTSGNT